MAESTASSHLETQTNEHRSHFVYNQLSFSTLVKCFSLELDSIQNRWEDAERNNDTETIVEQQRRCRKMQKVLIYRHNHRSIIPEFDPEAYSVLISEIHKILQKGVDYHNLHRTAPPNSTLHEIDHETEQTPSSLSSLQ